MYVCIAQYRIVQVERRVTNQTLVMLKLSTHGTKAGLTKHDSPHAGGLVGIYSICSHSVTSVT